MVFNEIEKKPQELYILIATNKRLVREKIVYLSFSEIIIAAL